MKRLIPLVLAVLLVFTGCDLLLPEVTQSTVPYYYGHTDHVAPRARRQSGFFLDTVSNERVTVYLAYNEPDGCVTHVLSFEHWDEPTLFCENRTFYYINKQRALIDGVESEGILRSVTFEGQTASLIAGDLVLDYIIRTDENYIYCAANQTETYIRANLALTQWEKISADEANGSNH